MNKAAEEIQRVALDETQARIRRNQLAAIREELVALKRRIERQFPDTHRAVPQMTDTPTEARVWDGVMIGLSALQKELDNG